MLYGYNSQGNSSQIRENKAKLTCYNCGAAGHEAHDCRDTSMESVSGKSCFSAVTYATDGVGCAWGGAIYLSQKLIFVFVNSSPY